MGGEGAGGLGESRLVPRPPWRESTCGTTLPLRGAGRRARLEVPIIVIERGATMNLKYVRWVGPAVVAVFLSGPALAAEALPAAQPARSTPAQTVPAGATEPRPVPTTAQSDKQRYQEREQQSQGLENWEGGAAIYIGGSVVAIALLLVLLILLL